MTQNVSIVLHGEKIIGIFSIYSVEVFYQSVDVSRTLCIVTISLISVAIAIKCGINRQNSKMPQFPYSKYRKNDHNIFRLVK